MAPNPVIRYNLLQSCLRSLVPCKRNQNPSVDIGFIFDIDGVLIKGNKSLPAARETLQYLQHNNIPFVLLTNRSMCMDIPHTLILREELRLDSLSTDQVIQAHTPFRQLVPEFGNKNILAIGRGDQEYLKHLAHT